MNGATLGGDGESAGSFEGLGNFETASASDFRPPSSLSKAEGGGGSSVGYTWSPAEEYSVDPETKKRESARSSSRQSGPTDEVQYHIAAVEGDSVEESYYLIDTNPQFPVGLDVPGNQLLDVDALASKLAGLESAQDRREDADDSPIQRALGAAAGIQGGENSLGEGSTGYTEISLGGGEAHSITVKVEKKGTTVAWEFMSEPKGLAFGLSFEEDSEGAKNEQVNS